MLACINCQNWGFLHISFWFLATISIYNQLCQVRQLTFQCSSTSDLWEKALKELYRHWSGASEYWKLHSSLFWGVRLPELQRNLNYFWWGKVQHPIIVPSDCSPERAMLHPWFHYSIIHLLCTGHLSGVLLYQFSAYREVNWFLFLLFAGQCLPLNTTWAGFPIARASCPCLVLLYLPSLIGLWVHWIISAQFNYNIIILMQST